MPVGDKDEATTTYHGPPNQNRDIVSELRFLAPLFRRLRAD